VGSGQIAIEYVRALRAIGVSDIAVLSRDAGRAADFASQHGLRQSFGDGEDTLGRIVGDFDGVILASPIRTLMPLLEICAAVAPKTAVLAEKPVALHSSALASFLERYPNNSTCVALNRLYFPSVARMREVLAQAPATSLQFTFTEWTSRINLSQFTADELARWGVSNSIHVTSTVFSLLGFPTSLDAQVHAHSKVPWHPSGAVFTGAGVAGGVPFSYHSDWTSAGRWSIRIYNEAGCYLLEPMEEVRFIAVNTVVPTEFVKLYEGATKCGFEPMLRAWMDTDPAAYRVSIAEMHRHIAATEAIFGYGT
jgi:predicted dehydrogenase